MSALHSLWVCSPDQQPQEINDFFLSKEVTHCRSNMSQSFRLTLAQLRLGQYSSCLCGHLQPTSFDLRTEIDSTGQCWGTPRATAHLWDRLLSQPPHQSTEHVQLPPAQGCTVKPLSDCAVQKGITKLLQKETPETGACLDWPECRNLVDLVVAASPSLGRA